MRGKRMKRVVGVMRMMMMVMMVVMGCNSGGVGKEVDEGKARKGDGNVIDLAKVSTKIKETVVFAESIKQIEGLVNSVAELTKAIGKKIVAAGATGWS